MLCFTILSRSDNLTNLWIKGLITWCGRFEMWEHLFLSKINVRRMVVLALMQIPFDGSGGFLDVGGNPVHNNDHWRVSW